VRIYSLHILMLLPASESHFVFEGNSMSDEMKGQLDVLHTVFSEICLLEDLLDN
jgi:hypothetical protein